MSEMKRKIIEYHLKREIDEMKAKYPEGVLDEVFKDQLLFPFPLLRYRVDVMIDNDKDPEPIMDFIYNYKLELFDAVMKLARQSTLVCEVRET